MAKKVLRINFAGMVRRKEEALRLNRRLKQGEIAEELGVAPHTIGKWMRGEVTQFKKEQLEQFMEYFDCSISDLLIEETIEDEPSQN